MGVLGPAVQSIQASALRLQGCSYSTAIFWLRILGFSISRNNPFRITPLFLLRGTSCTSSLSRKGKDHSFRPWLVRALLVAVQCSRSIPPCAPVPALSSCDAGIALPDHPSMSKPVSSAAVTAVLAERHSTHQTQPLLARQVRP